MSDYGIAELALRWLGVTALGGFSLWIIYCNYWVLGMRFTKFSRTPSPAPFAGGLLGLAALMICPIEGITRFWWVPLVVDPGCALLFLYATPLFTYMALKGDFKTGPLCRTCFKRIKKESQDDLLITGDIPQPPEAIPQLCDGACPLCGGTQAASNWA